MRVPASCGTCGWVNVKSCAASIVAVRDRNWGTVAPEVSELKIDRGDGAFRVTFTVRCRQAEIDFQWRGEITGAADGSVDYRMDGVAWSTFLRNRIGFCVLHAAHACAGSECTIEHVDGSRRQAAFPLDISPGQPFFNVRAISHEVLPGLTARVLMEGDTFETEDQRNWTDASFKTYCTPLALPFPVEISEGTRVRQSVSLRLVANRRQSARRAPSARREAAPEPPIDSLRYGPACRLPPIGLGMASHGRPLSPQAQSRLSAWAWTICAWISRLDARRLRERTCTRPRNKPGRSATSLHVAVALDELFRRSCCIAWRRRCGRRRRPLRLGCCTTVSRRPFPRPYSRWRGRSWAASLPRGGVCHGNQRQLCRIEPRAAPGRAGRLDLLLDQSASPCLRRRLADRDARSPGDTVTSARRFAGTSRIAVSPVTFKPRFNAVATGPEPELPPGELPPQVDPRQATLFAAGWTLGSLAALAGGGVERVTYFETTGWRGVMELDDGCPLPDAVPFDAWHVSSRCIICWPIWRDWRAASFSL